MKDNNYNKYNKFGKMEYNKDAFRVRSPVKTFRALEVYQTTIKLSNILLGLNLSDEEKNEIRKITEAIPRLIAESYGDKFDSIEIAEKKLNEAITLISNIITKIDLLRENYSEDKEKKEVFDKVLIKYGYQKMKILNLKKAWVRIFTK